MLVREIGREKREKFVWEYRKKGGGAREA